MAFLLPFPLPRLFEMRKFCALAKFAISACQKMDGLLVARALVSADRSADGEFPRGENCFTISKVSNSQYTAETD